MYTECPECGTGFRVSAKVLSQASGRVRCGGCGNAFSALEHLTEELPAPDEQISASTSEEDKFRETSRQLLQTLNDLAGAEDVVIEDTGVEWRVMDEDEEEIAAEAEQADEEDEPAEEADEEPAGPELNEPEEWTDILEEADDDAATADDIPLDVEEELAAIHSELSAKDDPLPVDLEGQFEMQAEAMGLDITGSQKIAGKEGIAADAEIDQREKDVTADAEIDQREKDVTADAVPTEQGDQTDAAPLDADEDELDGMIHLSLAEFAVDAEDETEPAVIDAAEDPEISLDIPEVEPEHTANFDLPEQSEEEMTINQQIDQELLAAAAQDQDLGATIIGLEVPGDMFDEESAEVETIIMEGDAVRGAMEREFEKEKRERALARFDNVGNLVDSYAANRAVRGGRRSTDTTGYGMIAGTAFLALLIGVQVVHAYREELSTYDVFNQTIGPLYRMLGNPVTPEWDIKGWQFEATNGSVAEGEDVLTISSRIGNRSEQALPYPLVHVSLTDRWEEIIGSRVLEPSEYLAGNHDPSRPVVPGDNFTAVITVDDPSVDATGFKVNVCYRDSPGRVRCATEDFKD